MFLWRGPFNLHYPNVLPPASIELGGAGGPAITFKDVAVIAIAVVLMIALTLFVERTKLGKAMRATAQDRDAAELMGIDINRTIAATFFIGALLAGAGGMIFGLYYNTITFDQGFTAGLVAFTAAVFGGIGNIQGAALGGLVIGMIQSLSDGYFDTAWTQVLIFAILVVGFAGLLDLRYAAFFAIGAYTYAFLASHHLLVTQFHEAVHLPFWIVLFVGLFVAAAFGLILGAPTLRLRGDYLAIVTLGFGKIVPRVFKNLSDWTSGVNGISALDKPVLPLWLNGPWSGDALEVVQSLKI